MRSEEYEEKIGDLDESYLTITRSEGVLRANLFYLLQTVSTITEILKNSFTGGIRMLKSYFLTTVRNIVRKKIFYAINISGLAVGITCCSLVYLYISDELSYDKFQGDRVSTLVLGGDYNFDLYEKTLYVAAEGIFSQEISGLYMTYNLRINEAVEFYQGYLLTQGRRYINSTLNYIYNDYVNFDLAHNYYHNFQEVGGTFQESEGLRHEVVLRIRLNF